VNMNTVVDCKQLVASIGDAVVVSNAAGDIVLWNAGAERMFGYTEAEALGKQLDIITPERLRHRHWEGYHKSMATGTTKYGNDVLRVPAIDKHGRAMSIAFTVAMLFEPDGKVSSIVAIIRDETARFAEDRALRKRIGELEAEIAAK
jgi:PAS domain S-box-containing protein